MNRRQGVREREAAIMRLRLEGQTFAQIAETVGFASASTCHRAYRRALDATVREAADDLRALEGERIDALWRAWFARATDPDRRDYHAALVCLRLLERRARMFGLDARTRGEADDALDAEIRALVDELTGQG